MYKWFRKCKTAEEGRKMYRDYSRQYHPDNGWKGEELKDITAEFKIWWSEFKNVHDKSVNASTAKQTEGSDLGRFIHIINNLSTFNFEIDIVGSWLWIRGNTYQYREQLKTLGCRWSTKHKLWYWTEAPYTKIHSKNTYSELKSIWGCETIKPDNSKLLD